MPCPRNDSPQLHKQQWKPGREWRECRKSDMFGVQLAGPTGCQQQRQPLGSVGPCTRLSALRPRRQKCKFSVSALRRFKVTRRMYQYALSPEKILYLKNKFMWFLFLL